MSDISSVIFLGIAIVLVLAVIAMIKNALQTCYDLTQLTGGEILKITCIILFAIAVYNIVVGIITTVLGGLLSASLLGFLN